MGTSSFFRLAAMMMLIMIVAVSSIMAKEIISGSKGTSAQKPSTYDNYKTITAANIFNLYANNGDGSYNYFVGASGFEFPKGSSKTAIYGDGLVWGGYHRGSIKVGGSVYRHGLQPGRILVPGTAAMLPIVDDPSLPSNRVYRVRPDINPNTQFVDSIKQKLAEEVTLISRNGTVTASELYNQYLADWNAWPAAYGAPFIDVNKNGTYEPQMDIPGVAGASQTLWYVANDVNSSLTMNLAGSAPFGLEMQRTIWVIAGNGFIGNSIFSRTKLINKSGTSIESMYLTQWSDPDLGDASDDYVGCDTLLNLGYTYNGKTIDGVYGAAVPAVGFVFLQGPIIPGAATDTAFAQSRRIKGYKNLGMSSFNFFINGNSTYNDPPQGSYSGTVQWYNLMMGTVGSTGSPYTNPTTGTITKFVLSGDPVSGTGWIDGTIAPPGDRRMSQSTGPFSFAAGDTQEVVVAASVMQGSDRLASVRLLKQAAGRIWKYHNGFPVASIAPLSQNYFSLQSKVTFVGSAILPAGQTGSGTWIVKRRPTGSTATVQTNADGSGFLQPDVVGDYTIGYVVGGSTSRPDTDFVSFKSTANKPPVVDFTFPSSIKVGDVVALDGTATRDPDNDSLAYSWSTGPFYSDFWSSYDTLKNLTNDTKATATFAARKSGTYNITLTVKDSFATVMQTKQLTVVPQVIGTISQSGQHSVTLYPMAPNLGYYFSSRFVPQSNGLWALINGAPVQLDLSANLAVPVQAYSVFPGATFAIGNSFIVGLNMMVFLTDEKGDITSSYVLNQTLYSHYPFNLTGYPSTGDSLVTGLVYAAPYLYVTSGIDGVYRFNCSNPASIVSAGHFSDGNYWRNARLDGGNLLSYNPRTGKVLVLDISNPSSMTKVTEFSSPVFPSKFGSIYAGVSNDTMFVFSGSSGYPLILQSTVIAPKSINSYNKYSSLWSDGVSIVTGTYDGLCIYNAVPLTAPQLTHQYITGWYDPSVYLTGTRILFSGIRGGDDTFDGIHDLQFVPTGVERTENLTPSQYELFQNYPNPFNPTTVITYALPDAGQVTLKLYDMLGREMQSLVSEHQIAGTYRYVLDVASLSTGTYFYRLTAGSFVATQKMVILK